MVSPDKNSAGLLGDAPDPLRYSSTNDHPAEAPGILREFMPSGVRVLDVGCGTGSVTAIVNAGKGNEVVGLEPDEVRAAAARARGLDVETGILDADFLQRRGRFDVIMFADVLEHVADPASLLRLALSGLTEKGVLLISVPNVAHWSLRLDLLRGRFIYTDYGIRDSTHLRWFTRGTLEALLRSQGLVIERFQNSSGTWMSEYNTRRPWKWVAPDRREQLVRSCTRRWPLLFGCQHVVKCRPAAVTAA
jgi:methionine biosynthesis protein MetW